MNNQKYNISRKNPPSFSTGIRTSFAEEICIVDFIDISGDERNCYSSVALTKRQAKDLISGLKKFIKEEED